MASNKAIVEQLQNVALFSRCSKSDLKIIARHTESMSVKEGTTIVREGDDGDALFVVIDGRASVERDGKVVQSLVPGDHFGELALLDPAPRAATVAATSDVELAVLGVRMFRVLLRDVPPLGAKLLADLASRVRAAG